MNTFTPVWRAIYATVICGTLAGTSRSLYAGVSTASDGARAKTVTNVTRTRPASPPTTRPDAALPKDRNYRPAQIGQVIFVLNDPSLLEHTLPPLTFHHKTLSDMLSTFSDVTNTNVAAGWAAMAQAGIKANRRVTLVLPRQGYKLDLVAVLKKFAPHIHMVISADQNVIFVNTQAADNQHLIMRTYWLEDLIANLPRYVNPKSFEKKNAQAEKSRQSSAGSDGARKHSAGQNKKRNAQSNIVQLITNHVEPKIWLDHGGKASISQVGNKVIVIAPASVQALLQGPSHYNPNAAPLFMTVSY